MAPLRRDHGRVAWRPRHVGLKVLLCFPFRTEKEAAAAYRRALRIQEKTLGAHHPRLAGTLTSLAILLISQWGSPAVCP